MIPSVLPFLLFIMLTGSHQDRVNGGNHGGFQRKPPTRWFSKSIRHRRSPPPPLPVVKCNQTRPSNLPAPPPPTPPSVAEDCDLSSPVSEAEEIVLQFTVKYLRLIQALDQKWHAKIDLIELPLNINLPTTCPYIKSLSNIKTLCQFLSDRTDDWSKKLLAV